MMRLEILAAVAIMTLAAGCDGCGDESGAGAAGSATAAPVGTEHDPPIKPTEVEAGYWYCDMGTVHYSRPERENGKCGVCNMPLKYRD